MNKKVKVLYIAGDARSGSTLLSRLLGEIEGIFNAGEAARYLFARFQPRDLPCGCGNEVTKCPFWKDIASRIPSDNVQTFAKKYMRIRYYLLLLSPFKSKTFQSWLGNLGNELKNLYTQIAFKANCNIIVDSSKTPDFAYVLSQVSNINVYIVHLIRDPRGVAFSWSQQKKYLHPQSSLRVGGGWLTTNLMVEYLHHFKRVMYLRIFYENFTQYPKKTLKKVINFIDLENGGLDFICDSQASLHTQHLLASNPDKLLETKRISIESRPWRLLWQKKVLVSFITFPLLCKYYIFPRWAGKKIG